MYVYIYILMHIMVYVYLGNHTIKIVWLFVSIVVYLLGSSETMRFTRNTYELDEN